MQRVYIYLGDRITDPQVAGQVCEAVLQSNGKCIRGKNGNMLVMLKGRKFVVPARLLRKLKIIPNS